MSDINSIITSYVASQGATSQGGRFEDLWRYELLLVDENSIKVNNIVIAVILLLIGLRFSGTISKWIENALSKVTKDKDASNILNKTFFYALFIVYIITILEIANVPLNIFAFIGGAIAISAGLGAKQLLNNFISGILMIVEKPVRIGDIIRINDVVGQVLSIGGRSTIVKQASGSQIIVPNSIIMQNNLSNWSHSNKNLQIDVNIRLEINNNNAKEYKNIQNKIIKAVSAVESLKNSKRIDVSLVSINKSESQFVLSIEVQEKDIKKIILMQNDLNHALIEELEHKFMVIYPSYLQS